MTDYERQTVEKMLGHGMSIATVASILELPYEEVLSVGETVGARLPDADLEDIHTAFLRLSAKIIEEMLVMLDESSPTIKTRLLIGMFGKLVPIINTQKDETAGELREQMYRMFAEMQSDDRPAMGELPPEDEPG